MTRPNVLLLALNALLAAVLAMAFVGGRAQWSPPAPLLPELPRLAAAADVVPADEAVIASIIERPLFFESRRPLPKEAPSEQANAAAPDPFEGIVLDGIYSAANGKGGISLVYQEGTRKRVVIGATLGEWELVSLSGRKAKFRRRGEERVLSLRRDPRADIASVQAAGGRRDAAEPTKSARSALAPAASPAAQAPQSGGPVANANSRLLEPRRNALERRRASLLVRRKQLEAGGAPSRVDPFGPGESAPSKQ